MKPEVLTETVKRTLGHPQLNIELNQEDYNDAVSKATKFYSRMRPLRVSRSTGNVGNNGNFITLSDDDKKNLIDVIDCDYNNIVRQNFNFNGLIDMSFIPYEWQMRSDRYLASMQKISADAKVLGYDGDWKYDEETGRVYFDPPVKNAREVRYVLLKLRTLEQIPPIDEDLVLMLVESFCRDKLADVRGKIKGIPSPSGTLELDSAEQRTMAADLREKVKTEITEQRYPTPMQFG